MYLYRVLIPHGCHGNDVHGRRGRIVVAVRAPSEVGGEVILEFLAEFGVQGTQERTDDGNRRKESCF